MQRKLTVLLRDYGYSFSNGSIYMLPIYRTQAKTYWASATSLMDAAERLLPIVASKEFYARFASITA